MSIFDALTDKLRVSFWNKAEKVVLLARFTTNTLWEVGLNAKFLNNKLNFDVTWYRSDTKNQTITVPLSATRRQPGQGPSL